MRRPWEGCDCLAWREDSESFQGCLEVVAHTLITSSHYTSQLCPAAAAWASVNTRFGCQPRGQRCLPSLSKHRDRCPAAVCSFSDQWWGGGWGKRDCCSGRQGTDQPGQAPLPPALWDGGLFVLLSPLYPIFSREEFLVFVSSEQNRRRWVEVMLQIEEWLFCAFVLQISSRRQIWCTAGEKGEVGRHMGERGCTSVPSLSPKNWSGLSHFESCCEASELYPSEISTQKPQIPRSCNIPFGDVALLCHLLTNSLPAATLTWVLWAQNWNKCMVLLAVRGKGSQHRKIVHLSLCIAYEISVISVSNGIKISELL